MGKAPLVGIPVSKDWRRELIKAGNIPPEWLPRLKEQIGVEELVGYLGRADVQKALGVTPEDVRFAQEMAGLGNTPLRRLGVTLISRDFRLALADHLGKRTGISLRSELKHTDEARHDYDPARLDEAEGILFNEGIVRPKWRDLVQVEKMSLSGTYVASDGQMAASLAGNPLHLADNVNYFHVKTPDAYGSVQLSALRFDFGKGYIVPIVGEFIRQDGNPFPDPELVRCGITRVRDGQGRGVQYPMLEYSARSLLQPVNMRLVIPVLDGKPRILSSEKVMREIFHEIGGDAVVQSLVDMAKGGVELAYQTHKTKLTKEKFIEENLGHAVVYMGLEILKASEHPDIRGRVRLMKVPCCAIQSKGSGCALYDGHHVHKNKEEAEKDPNIRVKIAESGHCYVVDKRYDGKSGIILKVSHQDDLLVPVGAASMTESLVYAREQLILENGGHLSGITVGAIKLLDDTQAPEMATKEICVILTAITDDTRRMESFVSDEIPIDGLRRYYKLFVVEKYRPPGQTSNPRHVDENYEAAREMHLAELFPKLGESARGVLLSNLTNPQDQNLMGNLSVAGGIKDAKDLAEITEPNQAVGFIAHLFLGLDEFGNTLGMRNGEIFRTKHFKKLLDTMLGGKADEVWAYTQKPHFKPGEHFRHLGRLHKLIGLTTDAWVRMRGGTPAGAYHQSDAEMVSYLEQNPPARERCAMDGETLMTFRANLRSPLITINRADGVISLEDALEPYRAHLEDRLNKVPKMRENEETQIRQFY